MIRKIIVTLLYCYSFTTNAALDMSQDRPLTTDIPYILNQLYVKPQTPTRDCANCPRRINRWSRCNAPSLKVKKNVCNNIQPDPIEF